jgi:hypothetical protein
VTDKQLKSVVLELWESQPETKQLGIPKLRALLREQHKDWQIGEKRLRRLRQEVLDDEDGAGMFDGMKQQTITTEHTSQSTMVLTRPELEKVDHINEDGIEYQLIPAIRVMIETGRKFKKDASTGDWVPAN